MQCLTSATLFQQFEKCVSALGLHLMVVVIVDQSLDYFLNKLISFF